MSQKNPTLLLLGCGQLGTALGKHYQQQGWRVVGARRNADALPSTFQRLGMDFSDPAATQPLVDVNADYVVITLTPGGRDEAAYQRAFETGLANLLSSFNLNSVQHLFFTSSTSVYHQNDGSVVDEQSPVQPLSFSGRAVLAAEQRLRQLAVASTAIRFGGIYGGDSLRLAERVKDGKCAPLEPVHYSNRIHRDDCVRVLQHLIERLRAGRAVDDCYLAVDNDPAPIGEVHRWLAGEMNVPYSTDAGYAHMAGSKRGDNRRLRDSGFDFIYPDYRRGYASILARR